MLYTYIQQNITYGKICFNKKKRDQAIAKRQDRTYRRTFPPSSFQLTPLIETTDDLLIEPIVESILLIEKPFDTVNLLTENRTDL